MAFDPGLVEVSRQALYLKKYGPKLRQRWRAFGRTTEAPLRLGRTSLRSGIPDAVAARGARVAGWRAVFRRRALTHTERPSCDCLPAVDLAIPLLAVLLAGGRARAAEAVERGGDVPPVSGAPMGEVAVRRGVQGPAGLFTARLSLLIDASKDFFGKPTSFAPDLYYSITDTVQVGLLHTLPMGWQTLPGAGLCLTGRTTVSRTSMTTSASTSCTGLSTGTSTCPCIRRCF